MATLNEISNRDLGEMLNCFDEIKETISKYCHIKDKISRQFMKELNEYYAYLDSEYNKRTPLR